jgi:hypothetical protein
MQQEAADQVVEPLCCCRPSASSVHPLRAEKQVRGLLGLASVPSQQCHLLPLVLAAGAMPTKTQQGQGQHRSWRLAGRRLCNLRGAL